MHGADLFHHTIDKVIEDPQFVVERSSAWMNVSSGSTRMIKLGQRVVPAQDINPASLTDVELTLQLGPKAFMDLSEDAICPTYHNADKNLGEPY